MGSAERMGLGINWYLPGQVSLSLILACLQSGTRVTWRFNSLNEPWDCLENISPVERKRLDYPREGMCTELQQGSAAACDTNVPYRGEVGKLWALRVQILLLWKIGRSPWGPQHWSTKSLGSRRRERERRGGLRHICRSNCWKRTLKTSLLLWQGWFLIINKIPPTVVKADGFVHRQVSSPQGQLRQARTPHCQRGEIHREGSIPRGTQHASADGRQPTLPHTRSADNLQEKQKGEDLFNCTALHKLLKGSEPSVTIFPFHSTFFYYWNENFRGLHHAALWSQ